MKLLIVLLFFNSLAFGSCDDLYRLEITKLSEGLKTMGNNPAASQVAKRRDSLAIVKDTLIDISQNNLKGSATQKFSQDVQVNPRTLQRIVKRANNRNVLCDRGVLLDHSEIGALIRNGNLN